jgi:hypothetical protein
MCVCCVLVVFCYVLFFDLILSRVFVLLFAFCVVIHAPYCEGPWRCCSSSCMRLKGGTYLAAFAADVFTVTVTVTGDCGSAVTAFKAVGGRAAEGWRCLGGATKGASAWLAALWASLPPPRLTFPPEEGTACSLGGRVDASVSAVDDGFRFFDGFLGAAWAGAVGVALVDAIAPAAAAVLAAGATVAAALTAFCDAVPADGAAAPAVVDGAAAPEAASAAAFAFFALLFCLALSVATGASFGVSFVVSTGEVFTDCLSVSLSSDEGWVATVGCTVGAVAETASADATTLPANGRGVVAAPALVDDGRRWG